MKRMQEMKENTFLESVEKERISVATWLLLFKETGENCTAKLDKFNFSKSFSKLKIFKEKSEIIVRNFGYFKTFDNWKIQGSCQDIFSGGSFLAQKL